jgi:hypothetical protein
MANIKEYIKKVMDGTVSLEEQQAALAQVEKTIVEAKQRRDESVGQKADMVVQALKTIEAKLEAKLLELNNTPAMQGVQGPTGKAGKDGVDGKDGLNGVSGKDGKDGVNGVDGKDGVSVVDAKIDFDGSLVVYLSDGNEIDCGQILSPDVAQNIIINSGGGGTSQTVTDTLVSLQNQIDTLTGIDGVLGDMAQQNANAVAITGGSITGITDLAVADGGTGSSTASGARTNLELGTIATQDANAVAITGGTIDNTSIGATTPSTVNATTITGQTGVLKGTGQNLLTFSEQLNNANWGKTGSSVSGTNTTTAPDGTLTADTYLISNTSAQHFIFQSITSINATSYTLSFYVKKNTCDFIQLLFSSATFGSNAFANFDINTGVLGTVGSATTATITSAGNDWYRCAITAPATSAGAGNMSLAFIQNATDARLPTYLGNGTDSVYLWGAQFELASSVGTYIPTTTTAVYGTPTLSFSGVSSIGLLSNGALYLEPAGNGAIQADATTSTAAGGNTRGANAVDWQTARTAASQVASGSFNVISGGRNNTVSSFDSAISGGVSNTTTSERAYIGGGIANSVSGAYSSIVGGRSNTAAGVYNFIGGGFTNSGTANAAVTTQSATMNGTTAVTLSGSNASIRVGQLILGTSIGFDTYVAAISGTSLTLSQAASGSSTSTLSFFTPYGVVVGGGNNRATGSYSFIGGGGDAGTAANRNVASGDWSFVGGGQANTASGLYSTVGGGLTNTASGIYSSVAGGRNSSATGGDSHAIGASSAASSTAAIAIGFGNTSNGVSSAVLGASRGNARSIAGNTVFAASNSPTASVTGITQSAILVLGRQTTDATPTALCSNTSAAGTTNQVILPNNSAYFFRGEVVSGKTGGGDAKGWTIEGVIKRGANAASTALVGIPTVTSTYADLGAATWDIAVTADTTNGGIRVTFTGQAATTIRTVCRINTVEMTF